MFAKIGGDCNNDDPITTLRELISVRAKKLIESSNVRDKTNRIYPRKHLNFSHYVTIKDYLNALVNLSAQKKVALCV